MFAPAESGSAWSEQIVTITGLHCNRLTGALPEIDGKPLLFACGSAGSLAGEPNTSKPQWTIYYARGQLANSLPSC